MKEGKMIIVTKHAVDRCVERLLKIILNKYNKKIIEMINKPDNKEELQNIIKEIEEENKKNNLFYENEMIIIKKKINEIYELEKQMMEKAIENE